MRLGVCAIGLLAASWTAAQAIAGDRLPVGFVYLKAIAPAIRQDMRYASPDNFTGAVVDGYEAPECILTAATATALANAAAFLEKRHPAFRLRVYDCYRPVRAVQRFASWSKEQGNADATGYYHPKIPRNRLFELGYIAEQSGHSRGNAVDLTIEPVGGQETRREVAETCTAPTGNSDGSADMGTTFDCFDPRSHTAADGLTPAQVSARSMLLEVMTGSGFENYTSEWWHYSLPGAGTGAGQDFPVAAGPDLPPAASEPGK